MAHAEPEQRLKRAPGRPRNSGWLGEHQSSPIATRVPNKTLEEVAAQCKAEMETLADFLRAAVDRELKRRKGRSP